MKQCGWMLICALICILLSACSPLPEEKYFPEAPIMSAEEAQQTVFAVRRGDITLKKEICCEYVSEWKQTLSYPISGEPFADMLVAVGDRVEKGQVVAQLDVSDLEEKLAQCEIQIQQLNLRISALEENRALSLERQRILLSTGTAAQLREAQQKVNAEYDAQRRALVDELHIAQLQKSEYEAQIAERTLRAERAGIVNYVLHPAFGDRSVQGETVVEISSETMFFRAQTDRIAIGQEVVIVAAGEHYTAQAAFFDEDTQYVYLALAQSAPLLDQGTQGVIEIVSDSREDVLILPEYAVVMQNGCSGVYCLNEQGVKTWKPTELGLRANGMAEIVAGLSEGEYVVID